jgi:hypothetical protein
MKHIRNQYVTSPIRLPQPAKVIDLVSGAEIAVVAQQIHFELKAPGTRVIRLVARKHKKYTMKTTSARRWPVT